MALHIVQSETQAETADRIVELYDVIAEYGVRCKTLHDTLKLLTDKVTKEAEYDDVLFRHVDDAITEARRVLSLDGVESSGIFGQVGGKND